MFKLCRIFNIDVYLQWSLLILAGLLTYMFSTNGMFVRANPNLGELFNITLSFVFSLCFIASVLAHELAHAVIGRRFGVQFSTIILFALGGMAKMENKIPNAKSEFIMAGAGPLSSILIGALCIGVSLLFGGGLAGLFFAYLGSLNVILGVFNLVPIYPLDGGRLLRSIIWKISKNYNKSTKIASYTGIAGGYSFIGLGVLMAFNIAIPFFGVGIMQGVWVGIIGLLISNMAKAELKQLR